MGMNGCSQLLGMCILPGQQHSHHHISDEWGDLQARYQQARYQEQGRMASLLDMETKCHSLLTLPCSWQSSLQPSAPGHDDFGQQQYKFHPPRFDWGNMYVWLYMVPPCPLQTFNV